MDHEKISAVKRQVPFLLGRTITGIAMTYYLGLPVTEVLTEFAGKPVLKAGMSNLYIVCWSVLDIHVLDVKLAYRREIAMGETRKDRLKIMIIEDEPDILTLYNDYLSKRGHQVINRYLNGDTIITDIEKKTPDIYLIDYRLPGNKNGIDVAIEILNIFPNAPILFITAHEPLRSEISKHPDLCGKNIGVLTKPVKLNRIETSMLNLVKKK